MTSLNRTQRTRTALGALAATALLTLSACGGSSDDDAASSDQASSSDAPSADESADASADGSADAAAEPDLEGIPDVVAEVNGEEITKDEFTPIYEATFAQAASQAQMGGEAPDEAALQKQTVDDLVDTELLSQEADARGIEVSDDEIEAELTTLAEQNGMKTADELIEAVEQQGLTADQVRDQVRTQVLVEKLATDEEGEIAPTEKELRTLYDQAKKQQAQSGQEGQSFPSFADARDQVEEQAKAQEIGEVAQTLVTSLREDADITVNL